MDHDLSFRCQVAPERLSFQSKEDLLEKVIILVTFVGFLADDKGHVKSSYGILVDSAVQTIFPDVILQKKDIKNTITQRSSNIRIYTYDYILLDYLLRIQTYLELGTF